MKLPNYKQTHVPEQKLTEYLLSETHAVGKTKARFFRTLGYSKANADQLRSALLMIAQYYEIKQKLATPF
ncbi:MAG: hypothetical protein JRI88_05115, partial [Deltaproteobacteria bacterium]|nr:hypothetical protein [Deltaproteobacteria bacterium]